MANEYVGPQPGQGGPYYAAPNYPAQPNPYPVLQPYAQPNSYPQPYGGLQPAPVIYPGQPVQGYANRPRTHQEKLPAYIYMILALIIIVLSIIALESHEWVDYCDLDISLTRAYSDGDSMSLSSLKNDVCDFSFPSTSACGDICSNLKKLISAGNVMRGIGITSIISSALSILRMVLMLVRQRSCCKGLFMRISLVVAMALWVLGTFVYVGNYGSINNGASKSSFGPGLGLAIAICVLQVFKCVLGNIAISKLIQ